MSSSTTFPVADGVSLAFSMSRRSVCDVCLFFSVTTTSFSDSIGYITTLRVCFPFGFRNVLCLVLYPTIENFTVTLSADLSSRLNLPLRFVIVTFACAAQATVASSTGFPSVSTTVPVSVNDCAWRLLAARHVIIMKMYLNMFICP